MTPPVRIHDSLTDELRELSPREPGKVSIYACGPTVYARIHVGNARPFVVFALFKRFLRHEGYEVTLVENITDINDKIYDAARSRRGCVRTRSGRPSSSRSVSARYVAAISPASSVEGTPRSRAAS